MNGISSESISTDILYLFTLKTMVNHLQTVLDDIDLEVDPTLMQSDDLDLMPELLGDLKSTLGTVVQIAARMFMTSPQN